MKHVIIKRYLDIENCFLHYSLNHQLDRVFPVSSKLLNPIFKKHHTFMYIQYIKSHQFMNCTLCNLWGSLDRPSYLFLEPIYSIYYSSGSIFHHIYSSNSSLPDLIEKKIMRTRPGVQQCQAQGAGEQARAQALSDDWGQRGEDTGE